MIGGHCAVKSYFQIQTKFQPLKCGTFSLETLGTWIFKFALQCIIRKVCLRVYKDVTLF